MRRLISKLVRLTPHAALTAVLGVAGCRHADVNRELVERELRLQEDELYRLHDEISEREKLLEAARRDNEALERELQQARAGGSRAPEDVPVLPPAPPDSPQDRAPRPDSGVPPLEVMPPKVIVPGLEGPPPSAPNGRSSWKSTRGIRRASFEVPSEESDYAIEAAQSRASKPLDDRVAKIVVNRRLTGGYNADHRLGDEGITVVIEPRNGGDRIVATPGDIAIVIVDPALSTDHARVARWDFSAEEVGKRLQRASAEEDGFHFELLWPQRRPTHERLMLFVRFTSSDGEFHEASQPILVDLGRDAANHTSESQ